MKGEIVGNGRPDVHDGRDIVLVTEAIDVGGTERVVEELAERLPAARIVATHFSELVEPALAGAWAARAEPVDVGRRKRHHLLPLYARRLRGVPLEPARLVISLTHGGWSLTAAVPAGARHVCYSAGLPPALYERASLYLPSYPAALRPLARAAGPLLRAYDRRLMRRPDRVVTNSHVSARALVAVHGRTPEVVHPPVRTDFFTPAPEERRHVLAVARLVPQKRLDVLVRAFAGLDETLVVVGQGAELQRLRGLAPPNVRFTGWLADEELRELYRSARALVCPSTEDFGIVMAEAHACGIPVIAPRAGGALEIVSEPATGLLMDRADEASIVAAVRALGERGSDPAACRASAERFSVDRFGERMEAILAEELAVTARRPGALAPEPEPLPI